MESKIPTVLKTNKEANSAALDRIRKFISENSIKEAFIDIHSCYTCDNQKEVIKTKEHRAIVKLPLSEKARANNLRKKVQADPELAKEIEIDCSVRLNEQFQPIQGVKRIGGDGKECTISHEQGTVFAVFFWSCWSKICEQLMAQKQRILQENKLKWGDKVRIVSASLDNDEERLEKSVNENRWSHLDHCVLPKDWHYQGSLGEGCSSEFPLLVLVNQKGDVIYANHPSNTNLEEQINNLLESSLSAQTEDTKQANPSESSREIYVKLRELIKNGGLHPVLGLKKGPALHHFTVALEHYKRYDKDLNLIEESHRPLVIDGAMGATDAVLVKNRLAEAIKAIPSAYIINRIEVLPSVTLCLGEKCNACFKTFTPEEPQYFSYKDKAHICKSCSDSGDSTQGEPVSPLTQQALIDLRTKSPINEVFAHRIKEQCYPQSPEEVKQLKLHKGIRCDACNEAVGIKTRYKCLNCLNIDICGCCQQKIEKGDVSLQERLENKGHDCQSHILQRFLFAEAL